MRGEYSPPETSFSTRSGSSPRAWGIQPRRRSRRRHQRFIPTCVGNTVSEEKIAAVLSVHPHVRGEYYLGGFSAPVQFGSSPRAWGIQAQLERQEVMQRFIPTCVGNTQTDLVLPSLNTGSSPRAWGILFPRTSNSKIVRFIPTCVGNTQGARKTFPERSVHPHVRGEYIQGRKVHATRLGSSPRAWGIRHWTHGACPSARFIPTCVGNTRFPRYPQLLASVHPHVRGEYRPRLSVPMHDYGSSPRAWGIRYSSVCNMETRSVHPHVRGEYALCLSMVTSCPGSSPRAWGILFSKTQFIRQGYMSRYFLPA